MYFHISEVVFFEIGDVAILACCDLFAVFCSTKTPEELAGFSPLRAKKQILIVEGQI